MPNNDVLPIRAPTSAKDWRVIGMWKTKQQFLVTLAGSEAECKRRVVDAIDDFSHADLLSLDSVWIEHWTKDDFTGEWTWMPTEELSLRKIRLRAAARTQHSLRRTA